VLAGQVANEKKTAAGGRVGRLLEVQIVDAADSIAYDAHDADDAVELGLLDLAELEASSLWRIAAAGARRRYTALDDEQFRRAAVHQLIDLLVSDLLRSTWDRLAAASPADATAASQSDAPLAGPSDELAPQQAELERLLFERVYRHPSLLDKRLAAGNADACSMLC
jgi:dGTPase